MHSSTKEAEADPGHPCDCAGCDGIFLESQPSHRPPLDGCCLHAARPDGGYESEIEISSCFVDLPMCKAARREEAASQVAIGLV